MIANGRTERTGSNSSQPALIGEVRSFFTHARQLASLQGMLLAKDLKESRARMVRSAIVLVTGAILFAGCVPVAMVAAALILANFTQLDTGWCMLIVSGIALVVATILLFMSMRWLRGSMQTFDRSREEFGKNIDSLFGEVDNAI